MRIGLPWALILLGLVPIAATFAIGDRGMRFGHPWAFWLLAFVPALAAALWLSARANAKKFAALGKPETLKTQFVSFSLEKRNAAFVLLLAALSALGFALARPQFGGKSVIVKREGTDAVFLLDVSKSMSARDASPDRLTRSKLELARLMEVLKGDRVGIIVFAGAAFVQCPLTTDYSAAKLFLKSISIGDVNAGGTALGKAFAAASKMFEDSWETGGSKVAVVVTDGEDFDKETEKEFAALKEKGVRMYAVGVGSAAGEPIPSGDRGGGYLKEGEKTVMSRRNDALLEKIAEESGGKYYNLQEGSDLTELALELSRLKKAEFKSEMYTQYDERFYVPLLGGFILLAAGFALDERRGGRLGLKKGETK